MTTFLVYTLALELVVILYKSKKCLYSESNNHSITLSSGVHVFLKKETKYVVCFEYFIKFWDFLLKFLNRELKIWNEIITVQHNNWHRKHIKDNYNDQENAYAYKFDYGISKFANETKIPRIVKKVFDLQRTSFL